MDTLPAFCRARVVILGVGNMLFGDDGFGPEVVDSLTRHYHIPDDIYLMDVGTGARKLLFTIIVGASLVPARPEEIIIVDAVDWGQGNGKVFEIPVEELPLAKVDDFSLHQVPTSNMLRELQEQCGVKVTVVACDVGVIPQEIAPGLSPVIGQAVIAAAARIAERTGLQLAAPRFRLDPDATGTAPAGVTSPLRRET
ncbi:MAG: hydrogenase maturation protease [Chloroflexi bacterium]|nr:hydrogenase maturation protease [Chloroflexota bacterium]